MAESLSASAPVLKELEPRGAQRGKTLTLKLIGERLTLGAELITSVPGTLSKLAPAKDPEKPDTQLPFLLQLPPDTPVGLYPIRVRTEEGLSNILLFSVGDLPETPEREPNDSMSQAQQVTLPAVVNGTLKGADKDYFRFNASAGQRIVFEVEARRAGSAIDPAVEVVDSNGREIASNDDAPGLGVDARVEALFPAQGEYFVVVHDSRYSDQEQNFYRLKMGTFAYADGIFPLGWKRGGKIEVSFVGGNLKQPVQVTPNLDLTQRVESVEVNLAGAKPLVTLPFHFVVSDLPEVLEPPGGGVTELKPSTVVNGRISAPREIDKYRLKVTPGQRWLVELEAASLGTSRLRARLTIYDPHGKRLASNEEIAKVEEPLAFEVPKDVHEVTLTIEDFNGGGGPDFGYRLHVARRTPDYGLQLLEPFLNVPLGGTAAVRLKAVRHGYEGPIQLSIPEAPEDLTVEGGYIPPKGTQGILTITARPDAEPRTAEFEVWGEGGSRTQPIRRKAQGSGLVTAVRGTGQRNDPTFGLTVFNFEPFTASWLGLDLPSAITRPTSVTLKVAEKQIRLVQGTRYEIHVRAERRVSGVIELKSKTDLPTRTEIASGSKIEENAETGKAILISTAHTPKGRLDLVLQGRLKVEGKELSVDAPAIEVDVVPAYSIELAAKKLEVKSGGKAELLGWVRREPSISGPVKVELAGVPEKISCGAVEVPPDKDNFRVACQSDPAAPPGEFEIEVASSVEVKEGEDKVKYSFDPVKARLVISPGAATEGAKPAAL